MKKLTYTLTVGWAIVLILCTAVYPVHALELDLGGIEEPLRSILEDANEQALQVSNDSPSERSALFGRLGMILQAHNLYAIASRAYAEALSLEPNPQWLYLKAICSMELGQNEQAASDLLVVVKSYPDVATIWLRLGMAQIRLAKLDEAEETLSKALDLAPQSAAVLMTQAELDVLQEDWTSAKSVLLKAFELDPNAGQIAYRIAQIEQRSGNLEAGVEWLDRRTNQLAPEIKDPMLTWVAQHSVNPTFFVSAARRAWQRGDSETAVVAFERAIELDPNNIANLLDYTRLLLNVKSWQKAKQLLSDLEAQLSDVSEYWYLRALLKAEVGDLSTASQYVSQSIRLEENERNLQLQQQIKQSLDKTVD